MDSQSGARYSVLGEYTTAENLPAQFSPYDPNKALRLSGMKEMTEEQSTAFSKYYDIFFDER